MYYVYLLKSEEFDQIYTGYTDNVEKRIIAHNLGQSPHTKKYKPWKLVAYFAFVEQSSAKEFEAYLKTGSGIAFSRRHFTK